MNWKPKYKDIDTIMEQIGFVSSNRGWVLPRKRESGKPIQYHLVPTYDGYNLHADFLDEKDNHKSIKKDSRDNVFLKILQAVDAGKIPTISKKMKKNYKTLKLETTPLSSSEGLKEK